MALGSTTQKSTRTTTGKTNKVFSAEERAAMKAHIKEQKAAEAEADGEKFLLTAIAEMEEPDRRMAERLHVLIKANAPGLSPKTWYGMPAYARDGNVICFFQPAKKFKSRYATLGFNDRAHLDEGVFWPVAYALKDLTPAEEARIATLVKKAVN